MNYDLQGMVIGAEALLEWAYDKGLAHGDEVARLAGENAELRETIATLNEKLHSLQETD